MSTDWEQVLLAYLHDPPDKAADIQGHVARACRYAGVALGRRVEPSEMKVKADIQASVVERFPMPQWTHLTVAPGADRLLIRHPLSGHSRELTTCRVDELWLKGAIQRTVERLGDDHQRRFLALWRFLPERLTDAVHSWLAQAPADTRGPDHTIWQHLDMVAGLQAAEEGGKGAALLSFALGPVQSFIATARTVRDLWSGSMILSYLTFRALLPVLQERGPAALVYPSLRGIPLLDLWLRDEKGIAVDELDSDLRRAPCLPNRFLAVVPWGAGGALAFDLAKRCREAAQRSWEELAEAVRSRLQDQLTDGRDWLRRWPGQVSSFFDFRTAVLPLAGTREDVEGRLADLLADEDTFEAAFPEADAVRELGPRNQECRTRAGL